MSNIIDNPDIAGAKLLVRTKGFLNRSLLYPYLWPKLALVPVLFDAYFSYCYEHVENGAFFYLMMVNMIIASWIRKIFILVFVSWVFRLCFPGFDFHNYSAVNTITEASHIRILTSPNHKSGKVCPIFRKKFHDGEEQVLFLYQRRHYLLNVKTQRFSPPAFLFDEEPELANFQSSTGLLGDLEKLVRNYGKNKFDIPVPTFKDLLQEPTIAHALEFVAFGGALSILNKMWYRSLLLLVVLVLVEMTTLFQRRAAFAKIQEMEVTPYTIYTYRDGKWKQLKTTELLPGDLVSVTRTSDDSTLPCDLLLTDGAAIVNEAMLSGEYTPLFKESIKLRPSAEKLQPEGLDKNSILHGGSFVLRVTKPENPIIPIAPDNGALAYVTKTGFETSQGCLVRRKILSTEQDTPGIIEVFLLILLILHDFEPHKWYEDSKGMISLFGKIIHSTLESLGLGNEK